MTNATPDLKKSMDEVSTIAAASDVQLYALVDTQGTPLTCVIVLKSVQPSDARSARFWRKGCKR